MQLEILHYTDIPVSHYIPPKEFSFFWNCITSELFLFQKQFLKAKLSITGVNWQFLFHLPDQKKEHIFEKLINSHGWTTLKKLPFFDGDSQLEIAGGVTCFSIRSFWLHVAASK